MNLEELRVREKELKIEQLEYEALSRSTHSHTNGVFPFYEVVTSESVEDLILSLDQFSRMYPGKPVRIILKSPGGSMMDGLALMDYLDEFKSRGHHVTIKVFGSAASMATVLLQAADVRELGRHSYVMIHEPSSMTMGRISDIEDDAKFVQRMANQILEILATRSILTKTQIKRRMNRKDWWLDAQEAVELGFADKITE